jgi:hypothetical protein
MDTFRFISLLQDYHRKQTWHYATVDFLDEISFTNKKYLVIVFLACGVIMVIGSMTLDQLVRPSITALFGRRVHHFREDVDVHILLKGEEQQEKKSSTHHGPCATSGREAIADMHLRCLTILANQSSHLAIPWRTQYHYSLYV